MWLPGKFWFGTWNSFNQRQWWPHIQLLQPNSIIVQAGQQSEKSEHYDDGDIACNKHTNIVNTCLSAPHSGALGSYAEETGVFYSTVIPYEATYTKEMGVFYLTVMLNEVK
jgi:hypothetical protein